MNNLLITPLINSSIAFSCYVTSVIDKKIWPPVHYDFSCQALDLQNELSAVEVTYNSSFTNGSVTVGFGDICFTDPTAPADETNCTVQSLLGFYQNSHQNLDNISSLSLLPGIDNTEINAAYIDHFETCTR